jgi:purine-nucleoside phosphorylase
MLSTPQLLQALDESATRIRSRFQPAIQALVVLGSGLGDYAERLASMPGSVAIPYAEIPHFPAATVVGHAGRLVLANLRSGFNIAVMQGRFHYYEGYGMDQVIYPIRVARRLGAETLVVTNAAGGIQAGFQPGDLMVIEDHLNLMGTNPLLGPNEPTLGPRFFEMSHPYDATLRTLAHQTADSQGIGLRQGVYAAVTGPSYETSAEIRMLRTLGADAVGMSTVPEVITARHMGMRVLGISCITNVAAGLSDMPPTHEEVVSTGNQVKETFMALLDGVLAQLPG